VVGDCGGGSANDTMLMVSFIVRLVVVGCGGGCGGGLWWHW
jgi:hypothetical protein